MLNYNEDVNMKPLSKQEMLEYLVDCQGFNEQEDLRHLQHVDLENYLIDSEWLADAYQYHGAIR